MTLHSIKELLHDTGALDAIIGHIGDAVSIQDTDGKIIFQNHAHKKLHGDHVGDSCCHGNHRGENGCVECPLVAALDDGEARSVITSCSTDAGPVYTETSASLIRDEEGNIVAGMSIEKNITDHVRSNEILRETKQMLEDVAEGITESILLLSSDYRIVWANKAALKQSGLAAHELIGEYCYKASHGCDHHCEPHHGPCPVRELLGTGETRVAEHEHLDRAGNRIYVEVSAYPITDGGSDIIRFVHISKDITERKKAEQEREKLIGDLQDALAEIKTLKGIIPICSFCKNIRNDRGYWEQIDAYLTKHSEAQFTHGICPECARKLYLDIWKDDA